MRSTSEALSFKRISLQDIQPLFGGQDITVLDDGEVRVHIVTVQGRLVSNKYRVQIEAGKLREVDTLLAEVAFEEIVTEDRTGVPDEARPKITVLYRSGKEVEKEKWANDEHPRFDRIYNWLVQLAKDIERDGTPYSEG